VVLIGTGAVATFAIAVVINSITDDVLAVDDDDDTPTTCSLPPAGPRNNFTVPQLYSRT